MELVFCFMFHGYCCFVCFWWHAHDSSFWSAEPTLFRAPRRSSHLPVGKPSLFLHQLRGSASCRFVLQFVSLCAHILLVQTLWWLCREISRLPLAQWSPLVLGLNNVTTGGRPAFPKQLLLFGSSNWVTHKLSSNDVMMLITHQFR